MPDVEGCLAENNTKWENSPITFDDVPNAYISLFQVATFKGWLAIMADATDSRNVRRRNSSPQLVIDVVCEYFVVGSSQQFACACSTYFQGAYFVLFSYGPKGAGSHKLYSHCY